MTTILIINAVSSGVAVLSLVGLSLRKRLTRRVQRVYVTVDGRQVTRDEPA
jgi:hypothetical protein